MRTLGLSFEVIPSSFEEPAPDTHPDPAAFARHLAECKARDIAAHVPSRLVIGADTIVVLGEQLLAKPADVEDAVRILTALSGQTHRVITGVAVLGTDVERVFHVATDVTFRELSETEIRAYVATGEPMDKAGAYGIQHFGGLLIEGIHGDYFNVVGLPIATLAQELRALGLTILGV